MTERDSGSSGGRPAAPVDTLSVEVDRHPLIPTYPSHFTPTDHATRTADPYAPPPAPDSKRRRRRFGWLAKLLVLLLIPLLILALAAAGGALYFQHKLSSNIERFADPFVNIPAAERPVAAAGDVQNILLLGSDSRISAGDPKKWQAGAQRTDAIMILHIPANRSGAYVMSIPRDSWVPIPGHGTNKINAAFSFGGPTLMVRTVEQLTKIRIDHIMVADFTGFSAVTDAIGGVQITVPKASGVPGANVPAGTQNMDGATALKYVRERYHLPGGDFDREKRQQNWMRAIASKTLSKGVLTHPVTLYDTLSQFTKLIEVDKSFSIGDMRSLALSMRSVRSGDLHFMTTPVKGTGRSPDGRQSIVLLSPQGSSALFQSMAADEVDSWVSEHPGALLGNSVR